MDKLELLPSDLKASYDAKKLNCKTTEELKPLEGIIGQDRAVKALKFGLEIQDNGFNIYVSGYTGTGRTTGVSEFVQELARQKPVPPDWCYVNNFNNSYEPNAISLPAGMGRIFQGDMKALISSVRNIIPRTFESKDYSEKKDSVVKNIEQQKDKLLSDLNKRVQEQGFVLKSSQIGVFIVPIIDGKLLNEQDFLLLSEDKKQQIQAKRTGINEDLKGTMEKVRDLEKQIDEEIKKLNHEVALFAIEKNISDLKEKFRDIPEAVEHIETVKSEILQNLAVFITGIAPELQSQPVFPWMKELPFKKYEVNLVVDNSSNNGAPVIIEHNPTYQNIFGRIEKEAQFGVLTTDFTMIRGGSLHKASGGFIVIPAEELLKNFFSWDSLKNSLINKKIAIEEAGEKLGYITTKGLKPEAIPLKVKVILIGSPMIYDLLFSLDQDFKKLFKVRADFDLVMDRTDDNIRKYASFACTLCSKEGLKHMEAASVAKIIEYGSRLAENKGKISTRFSDISDIIFEANFYAGQENTKYIKSSHIEKAIEEKAYRSNLIHERIKEMIKDETILIDTIGKKAGQVNGLSVSNTGDYIFGRPSRVTASIGIGKEGIMDIERETKLGGPIHTKGVLILGGFLTDRYSKDKPMNLAARVVFEQSYGGIEGDSASSAELYAILSALSDAPLRQDIAVTGSVNQKGQVQAIGGVNEKIEGFFEVCCEAGLTGQQGVIIPAANIRNLMLKDEVIDSVRKGLFHIFAVNTIDEGIEILTGIKSGNLNDEGSFEEGSINYFIDKKIRHFTDKLKESPQDK